MERHRLGASDLELSSVGLGAWAIGGLMWGGSDEADAVAAIRASLDAGINWIDTAPAYGCGRSEEIVGRALREHGGDALIATKCGLRWDRADGELRFDVARPEGGRVRIHYNLRPDSLREECEASLRRLGVERIDLYQIHWPYAPHPLEDALGELLRLREEGKLRALGVSNFGIDDLDVARRVGGIVSVQTPYSLLDRRAEPEILPWCRRHGIGVLAYSPLGRGLLAGRIRPETVFPESDHRGANPAFRPAQRQRVLAALARARPRAERLGVSLGNLAVAWVLAGDGVTAALVGARDAAQAEQNARAADIRLPQAERRALGELFPELPWAAPPSPGKR